MTATILAVKFEAQDLRLGGSRIFMDMLVAYSVDGSFGKFCCVPEGRYFADGSFGKSCISQSLISKTLPSAP